jgi:hypothetical protein
VLAIGPEAFSEDDGSGLVWALDGIRVMSSGRQVLVGLEGNWLEGVTFVMDYLQLLFTGHRLSVYVWPRLHFRGRDYVPGAEGYRDALCGMIGLEVRDAFAIQDEVLELVFADGQAAIRISLRPEDRVINEAVMFTSSSGEWTLW